MPYTQALRKCVTLFREQGFNWLMVGFITFTFAFFICPEDNSLQSIKQEVTENREEVLTLVKRTENLQNQLQLVENKDPFTMERLIREEFRLKRIKPHLNN